ncbi:isochorismatase family protein [Rubripirellula reticaptiva]|uniref:Trehalose utilization n=1 Tax=Rubripirellula reticaptiva TaxID=2528013 RepID=A0A5C6F474_9BACT|nr:isochorismatase family protein [Rubripirellula reticaptiva]TWU56148.1 Trehalose utilization [Rubripirellula reticaptiva]
MTRFFILHFVSLLSIASLSNCRGAEAIPLRLRHQVETQSGSGIYHRLEKDATWSPSETALIVCDMWDAHHCYRAVQRATEFAPRLERLVGKVRDAGVTIIHAPSGCTAAYEDTRARKRALDAKPASDHPPKIADWCTEISASEMAVYPIDQSDGGEDDSPQEHAAWAKKLEASGRNPLSPWMKQMDAITIDQSKDFISDSGTEIWNILQELGIKNVILTGVHTNMCVLGRPFGLRRMAMAGKNVVLMRDLTDTMYNPAAKPYVSHFTGTDLIVDHIERHVCPTISSDQILGGKPFRFRNDRRPHLAIMVGEAEYRTSETLPRFALEMLGTDYRVSWFFPRADDKNRFPGLDQMSEADALLISVRRRTLPADQLEIVQRFVQSGKPVVGIRTASHAFSLRGQQPPEGCVSWPEFDATVFGGNYTNHYGNDLKPAIELANADAHPLASGWKPKPFQAGGSLYVVSPVAKTAAVILNGKVDGHPAEPVAWTYQRSDGGRSFYTSLGHTKDFEQPEFNELLKRGIDWAVREVAH